jgi:hypothetical protein
MAATPFAALTEYHAIGGPAKSRRGDPAYGFIEESVAILLSLSGLYVYHPRP